MKVNVTLSISVDLGTDPGEQALAMTQLCAFVGGARAMWSAMQEQPSTEAEEPVAEPVQSAPAPPAEDGESRRARRLAFAEFDAKVRAEMQRLAVDGHMPGYAIWDQQRDPELPTLNAVVQRYKCKSPSELASLLGYQPPQRKRPAPTTNGHHDKEFL